MIVILSYFRDGSGKPKLTFVEQDPDQVETVVAAILAEVELWKDVKVYRITNLESPPRSILAVDTEIEE